MKMVNIWVFITLLIFVLINLFLVALCANSRVTYLNDATRGSDWCYPDWICNEVSGKASSPVLETLPLKYACKLENFTVEGENTCVCPIQFRRDYDLNQSLVMAPVDIIQSDKYICDNYYNQNPILTIPSSKPYGIGPCSIDTCIKLWNSPNFQNKAVNIGGLRDLDPQAEWKIRNQTRPDPIGTDGVDYDAVTDIKYPTYGSSLLMSQITKA